MSCEYGCSQENVAELCARCGHPKSRHSTLHPHRCNGPLAADGTTTKEPCECAGFVKRKA